MYFFFGFRFIWLLGIRGVLLWAYWAQFEGLFFLDSHEMINVARPIKPLT